MNTIPPQLFISYSHDSEEHKDRCYALRTQLRKDGCNCIIDRDIRSPKEGWPRWCKNKIKESDFVIVVCTKIYCDRYEGNATQGKGVKYEGFIITQNFYDNHSMNEKFIPVCFEHDKIDYIPSDLRGSSFYVVSNIDQYQQLLRQIYDKPEFADTEIGSPPDLKSKNPTGLFEDKTSDEAAIDSDVLEDEETSVIELTIDRNFDSYLPEQQDKLADAIKLLLNISDLKIIRKKKGSVKLAIELSSKQAEHLLNAVQLGLLDEYHVVKAVIYKNENQLNKEFSINRYERLDHMIKLISLQKLSTLSDLEDLYLESSQLNSLENFPNLPNLRTLRLNDNRLNSLKGLPDLPKLVTLYLGSNQLNSLEYFPNLPNLENLYLGTNLFKGLNGFPSIHLLRTLALNDNQLDSLEDFPDLPNLYALRMSGNKISSLGGLTNCTSVTELYLDGNLLNSCKEFPFLPNLRILRLNHNQLNSLEGFPNLSNLNHLYLENNQIDSLIEFPDLPKLQTLYLSFNPLTKIDVAILENRLPECEIFFDENPPSQFAREGVPADPK